MTANVLPPGSLNSVATVLPPTTPTGGGGAGTVTSVALAAPAEFVVSGSPVIAAGTLTLTKATEVANTVWAGPTSGGAAQPTFRALVPADIPAVASTFDWGKAIHASRTSWGY